MSDKIDVLLYGLGAIGSFYAFILSRSDRVRLTVVARSNYDAVKAHVRSHQHLIFHKLLTWKRELPSIARTTGTTPFARIKVRSSFSSSSPSDLLTDTVVRSPAEAGPVDYVVCAHKAIDQEDVAVRLAPVVDQDRTTIVIIQNGVGNEEAFRNQFPKSSILTCVTWVGAIQNSPGIIKHTKSEDMQIGLFPNPQVNKATEQQRLDTFVALLQKGETKFTVLEDMQPQRWEKVVWNVAWNSLTTLTMVDTQTWLHSSPDAEPYTRRLMYEVIQVARGCGVQLEDGLIDQLMDRINAMPGIGSSMQTDCKSNRPMEIDVILGFPVRKSRELGIPAPYLESLYVILRAVDGRIRAAL